MPAYTAETALERVARHARERGGYTMRLDSLRAPGSAANDDPNTRRCIDLRPGRLGYERELARQG